MNFNSEIDVHYKKDYDMIFESTKKYFIIWFKLLKHDSHKILQQLKILAMFLIQHLKMFYAERINSKNFLIFLI